MTIFIFWILLIRKNSGIQGLIFREDQFDDLTKDCLKSDGKPLRYVKPFLFNFQNIYGIHYELDS